MTDQQLQLTLCGEPSGVPGTEPCPREKGHDGDHYTWWQSFQPGRKRGRNGITIANVATRKTIMHVTFDGYAEPEEIAALVALSDVAAAYAKEKGLVQ